MCVLVLITYDVNTESPEGRRRLRKIAKTCQNYGQRVQWSVFECMVDSTQYRMLKGILCELMGEDDNIRFYNLGKSGTTRVEQYGKHKSYDAEHDYLSI